MKDYSNILKLQFEKDFPLDWIVRDSSEFRKELFNEFMNTDQKPSIDLFRYDFFGITSDDWFKLYKENHREESKTTDRSGCKECMAPIVKLSEFDKKNNEAEISFNKNIANNTLDKKYFVPDLSKTNIVKVFSELQKEFERFREALLHDYRSMDKEVTETAKNIHLIIERLQPQFVNYTLRCLIEYIQEMDITKTNKFDTANKSLINELKSKSLTTGKHEENPANELSPILKTKFQDIDNLKEFHSKLSHYIKCDLNSWMYWFGGVPADKPKQIEFLKTIPELLYFMEILCPDDFKVGNRKIKELNQIFKPIEEKKIDSIHSSTTVYSKKSEIEKLFK